MYVYAGNDHIASITDRIEADNHNHLMVQLSVSLKREFTISVEGQQIVCEGIVIDSNTNHTLFSNHDLQFILLVENTCNLAKQLNQKYLEGQSYHVLNKEQVNEIRSLLEECQPILRKEEYLQFYDQLLEILHIKADAKTIVDERISCLLSHLKNCTETEHILEEMAKSVFLSQSRLSHLFKKETGMRLSSYLVLHKLQKAMFYIFAGKSITEAASMAGFDSPSHFAAVSKKSLGMTARSLNEDSVFLKVSTF
jgi:AraC-like DNA-binding protein